MIFEEQEIDFSKLTDKEFEELCFDLLLQLDFRGLIWRQGGADSGRDIEGKRAVNDQLVGAYEEKWFFECKHYKKGVPVDAVNSKIAWADAEKPRNIVIITSSYLSNSCRIWLEKIIPDKPYTVHLVEGKQLKNVMLGFPTLVSKYFMDQYSKLLIDHRKSWLIHDLIPEPEIIYTLVNNINDVKLSFDELAFLWCAAKIRSDEVESWINDNEPFYLDSFFYPLACLSNTSDPLISEKDDFYLIQFISGLNAWEITYPKYIAARIVLDSSTRPRPAMYSFVRDSEGEGLEVLIEATSDFPTKIRHVTTKAGEACRFAKNVLINKKI
jgi:hypothetical protein